MEESSLYTSEYSTTAADPAVAAAIAAAVGIASLVGLVLLVIVLVSMWKLFTKAGKPGWAALVPIYNLIVFAEVVGRPAWMPLTVVVVSSLLSLIPFVGLLIILAASAFLANDLSKSFGKSTGFTVGLVLLPIVFYPMLAFGSAKYVGPVAASSEPTTPPASTPPAAPAA